MSLRQTSVKTVFSGVYLPGFINTTANPFTASSHKKGDILSHGLSLQLTALQV